MTINNIRKRNLIHLIVYSFITSFIIIFIMIIIYVVKTIPLYLNYDKFKKSVEIKENIYIENKEKLKISEEKKNKILIKSFDDKIENKKLNTLKITVNEQNKIYNIDNIRFINDSNYMNVGKIYFQIKSKNNIPENDYLIKRMYYPLFEIFYILKEDIKRENDFYTITVIKKY